jgi:hypothetical protein
MAVLVYLCLIMTRDHKKIVNQRPLGLVSFFCYELKMMYKIYSSLILKVNLWDEVLKNANFNTIYIVLQE